jgi:hypothetical protein
MKPEEFAALFPRIRKVITNTFSHTAEHARYRVIIPTTQRLSPKAYEHLYDGLATKLKDAGYSVDRGKAKHKPLNGKPRTDLDCSRRTSTSLFYFPAQAKDPSQSFCDCYNDLYVR